jgi:protoporphyrinogen oxidase
MTESPLIAGNNLAVLAAAAELARRGRPPTLLTDGRPLGGHFAGMQVDGDAYDLGMVLLEKLPSTAQGASLATYRSEVRNDWTRFGDLAANWLDEQLRSRRAPTPQCLVDSKWWPDYLIANRLDAFANAGVDAPDLLDRADPRHASQKNLGSAYEALSYAEAVRLNHGQALHERYIEPFLRKLLNVSSAEVLARYHRAAWVPLFHPETLTRSLRGESVNLPEYPFWVPDQGHVGALVSHLIARLVADGVRVVSQPLSHLKFEGGRWTVGTQDGAAWSAPQMVLGVTPERARSLIGLPPLAPPSGASVALLMARVKSSAIGQGCACLMVVDEGYAAYRLTDQDALAGRDPAWHRVVIEANPERVARLAAHEPIESVLKRELAQLLAVDDPASVQVAKCVTARNALMIPTAECVSQAARSHADLVESMPGLALTGALLGYGVASLNDQVVQGLKIAEDCVS